jgi:adenine deaminase
MEYPAVAAAFGWGCNEMVAIALDALEACWLDDAAKAALRRQITAAATALAPDDQPSGD